MGGLTGRFYVRVVIGIEAWLYSGLCVYISGLPTCLIEKKSLSHIPITLVSPPNTYPPSRTAKLTAPPLHQHVHCSTPPTTPNQPPILSQPTNQPIPQKTTKPKNPETQITQSPIPNPQPNSPNPPPPPPRKNHQRSKVISTVQIPRTKFLPLISLQLLHLHFFSTSNRTI